MSRQLDPDNLNEDDLFYIHQRPTVRQEFILQGYDDPLEGYEPPSDDDSDEEAPQASVFDGMSKKDLAAEINSRNEDRSEEDQIVPEGSNKPDLLAALVKDDESQS